jgi:hypothetical protein
MAAVVAAKTAVDDVEADMTTGGSERSVESLSIAMVGYINKILERRFSLIPYGRAVMLDFRR